jgi:xylulokinase
MGKYLIGIDIGTSSVKSIICDAEKYKVISESSAEHNLYSPFPGWAEENPEEWWRNTIRTVKNCIDKIAADPGDIKAIGVTGMVPAFIQLDKEGNLLRPSIQQSDARTYGEMEEIEKKIDRETFFKITGCSLNQQMIAPKILWMRNNEPEKFSKTSIIFGSYDYINYKLTGTYSVESNWALESGLYNIHNSNWSDEILDILGIKRELLPYINHPTTIIGQVKGDVAREMGLLKGTPVIAGVADHISSAFISGVREPGSLIIKLGSAGDILFSADKLITDKRLFIDYHLIPGNYYLNGCMASSGSLIKWFKEQFINNSKIDYKEMDIETLRIESGSNGIIVLPYFIGEKTPIFNPIARGVIFGLTTYHTKFHIYKAILESIGYAFKHHIDIIKEIGFVPNKVIASDAGAKSLIWVQILSNIFGTEINLLKQNLGSSLGAAFTAGMATNYFKSWDEAEKFSKISETVFPDLKENLKYKKFYSIYRKIYIDLIDEFKELNLIL